MLAPIYQTQRPGQATAGIRFESDFPIICKEIMTGHYPIDFEDLDC